MAQLVHHEKRKTGILEGQVDTIKGKAGKRAIPAPDNWTS